MLTPFDKWFDLSPTPLVLFEDYYMAVLQKPFGYTVEKHHQYPSLEFFFTAHLQQQFPQHKKHFIGIVHRLDAVTGGLVVMAKTPQALKHLNKQFEEKTAVKKYTACLEGSLSLNEGKLDGFITEDKKNRTAAFSLEEVPTSKKSVLHYTVIDKQNDFSLVEILLETGRFHQIRASFSFLGHPIVNDEKYGAKKANGENRIWLCAKGLNIAHPKTGEPIDFNIS